jgi:NAD(P)-dependent dehydrogenase (short-subunit alcohol dehydrogenase family)
MRIAVIDGQGGGIGKALVEKLRGEFGSDVEILALGTNALATSAMLKSGADEGATGENAIVYNADKIDIITGAIGIISANSMLGELTPAMAKAIAESSAPKVLIPMNRCNIQIAGVKGTALPQYIEDVVQMIRDNM